MRFVWKAALALVVASLLGSQARAALVTFIASDPGAGSADPRPSSNAAAANLDVAASSIGTLTIIDFESSPLGSFNNLLVATGVTMDGSDVSGSDQSILNAPFGTPDSLFGYNTTSGGTQFVSLFGGTLTFSFAPGINAFGAYLSGLQGAVVGTQTVTFFDGSSQVINIPQLDGGIAFVGFTDDGAQVASVTIDVLGDIVGVDDVRVGRAGEQIVPEPGQMLTWTILAACGAVARVFVRRRNPAA